MFGVIHRYPSFSKIQSPLNNDKARASATSVRQRTLELQHGKSKKDKATFRTVRRGEGETLGRRKDEG
jgi:hypothetical protein